MQTDFRTSFLLVETINKLGEIQFFKTVPARVSLFLLVEIEFLADGNHFFSRFFGDPASDQQQSTAASGSSFSFNWNIFFTLNPSFRLVETSFLSAGNSIFFILRFFQLGETIIKIWGSKVLKTNHIPAGGNHFFNLLRDFSKWKQLFRKAETWFSKTLSPG